MTITAGGDLSVTRVVRVGNALYIRVRARRRRRRGRDDAAVAAAAVAATAAAAASVPFTAALIYLLFG